MEFLSFYLYLSIVIPMCVVLVMSHSKTKTSVCFTIIGLTVALFCGELNGIIFKLLPYSYDIYATTFSPIVEEVFKMFPIVIYAFTIKQNRQSLIENSIAVGVGFAILENTFVFASNIGNINLMTAILRAFGSGIMHVMTTLLIGFGFSFIVDRRKLYLSGSIGLLTTAITYHSIYNYLICSEHYIVGFLMPAVLVIPTMIFVKGGAFKMGSNDGYPDEKPEPKPRFDDRIQVIK